MPTVRQAERGHGSLLSFLSLAAVLEQEIGGRSLPPGGHLGGRLATMRDRRKWSRRTVAALAGISATTLAVLEQGAPVHLDTPVQVARVLGIRLCLHPVGHAPSFWSAAAISSTHDGWTTPPDVMECLYAVVGNPVDLDPCSPVRTGPKAPVRARLRYTMADDGLDLPWIGTVYVNPPYGRTLPLWIAKARHEAESGRAMVLALVPARTDTRWWHDHIAGRADVWLLKGRLAFGSGGQPAPFPSALVAWSAHEEHRTRMRTAFPDAWHVPAAA